MPLLSRRRILAAKVESTPGTAVTPGATDGAWNIFDAVMNPDLHFEQREGQGSFEHLYGTTGARMGTCTFRTQLVGGATIPPWASVLLPACGLVDDSDTFRTKSYAPGSNGVTCVTISLWIDGTLRKLHGCAGNAVFSFQAGKVIDVNWTFMGCWNAPTDDSLPAPNYPDDSPLRFASSGITLGGSYTPKLSRLTLDLGNQLGMLEDSTTSTGYKHAIITGRRPTVRMDAESALIATYDWYGKYLAGTQEALTWTVGSAPNSVVFTGPKAQIVNINEGDRNKVAIENVEYQLNRSADAGDDCLTIGIP